MTEKTQEQLAAEAEANRIAAEALAKKEAEKAAKAQEKADKAAKAKADKEAKAAADKAKKEAAAADREAKKAEEKAKKEAEKAAKEAAKVAVKMPEQNGIRRPKPETETGKVWALADAISSSLGQPTPIANLLAQGQAAGLNDSTMRTQYARWRAFHGITGRVSLPVVPPVAPAAPAAPADPADPVAGAENTAS